MPFEISKGERLIGRLARASLANGEACVLTLRAPTVAAASGSALPIRATYNTIDARGSYTIAGYRRAEVEFAAPRLFKRRGQLSIVGGWREATQVGFYGLGTATSKDNRTNYGFQEPYGSALLTLRPTRRTWLLRGGLEFAKWSQQPWTGTFPSVETAYTPSTLPGLGAEPTCIHAQGTFGFDWRTAPAYARRGGFLGVTVHDYTDRDDAFVVSSCERSRA